MITQLEQLQGLFRIDPIGLGGRWKDFLEAGQLQIIDVEQRPAFGANQAVEGPDVAVVTFHGHGDRHGMPFRRGLDTTKEIVKASRRMRNVKFLEQPAIRQPDRHVVTTRADIDPDTKFQ